METIDLCDFGPIFDLNQSKDLSSNLFKIFRFIIEEKLLTNKEQKYLFLVSNVSYEKRYEIPQRYDEERTRTLKTFLKYWKLTFDENFSLESFNKQKDDQDFITECNEKEAQRRAAWSSYTSMMLMKESLEEEQNMYEKVEHLSYSERESALEKLREKNRQEHPPMLLIG